MQPLENYIVSPPKTSSCVESPTIIYKIILLDVEGCISWEWIIWCEVLESSIQLFEDAYKAWLDSACNLVEEGLGTEFFCYYMDSFNGSSFIQHLDSSCLSMTQKL